MDTQKPDDIPGDIWDLALAALATDGGDGWHLSDDLLPILARAIIAARTQEREYCALAAENEAARKRGIAAQRACYDIASAIRNRDPEGYEVWSIRTIKPQH